MKVGLIHIGGALPNIALMRLSTYHKKLGDEVILNATPMDRPDKVYISTLFTWRDREVQELKSYFSGFADVLVGGSGYDLGAKLPAEVDTMENDYSLYGIDYGMGYSSRGCVRKCAFCPVPKAEGEIHEDKQIISLLNPLSNKLALLDNNFFASDWKPKIREIEERGLIVDWPQGNDIRLLTDEIAETLWRLNEKGLIRGDKFKQKGWLHFAWDLPSNDARTEDVVRGIKMLYKVGFKGRNLRFYVLIGYPGYSFEEEMQRIGTLHALGIEPYVMVYRDFGKEDNREKRRIAVQKWNNGHAWKTIKFADFRYIGKVTPQGANAHGTV